MKSRNSTVQSLSGRHRTGYARGVLNDGVKTFRYRSRVRLLLGLPEMAGVGLSTAGGRPPVGFRYQNDSGFDGSWPGPHPAVGPPSPDAASTAAGAFTQREFEGHPSGRLLTAGGDFAAGEFEARPVPEAENSAKQSSGGITAAVDFSPHPQAVHPAGPAACCSEPDDSSQPIIPRSEAGLREITAAISSQTAGSGRQHTADFPMSGGASRPEQTGTAVRMRDGIESENRSTTRHQLHSTNPASASESAPSVKSDPATVADAAPGDATGSGPAAAQRETAGRISDSENRDEMESAEIRTNDFVRTHGPTGMLRRSDRPVFNVHRISPDVEQPQVRSPKSRALPASAGDSAGVRPSVSNTVAADSHGQQPGVPERAASPAAGNGLGPEVRRASITIPGQTLNRFEPAIHSPQTRSMLSDGRIEKQTANSFAADHGPTVPSGRSGPGDRFKSFLARESHRVDAETSPGRRRDDALKPNAEFMPGGRGKTESRTAPGPEPARPSIQPPAAGLSPAPGQRADPTAGAAVDQLRQAVHQLAGKLSGPKTSGEQRSQPAAADPPPASPPIVLVRRPFSSTRRSCAFWERHHLGRSHLRCLR